MTKIRSSLPYLITLVGLSANSHPIAHAHPPSPRPSPVIPIAGAGTPEFAAGKISQFLSLEDLKNLRLTSTEGAKIYKAETLRDYTYGEKYAPPTFPDEKHWNYANFIRKNKDFYSDFLPIRFRRKDQFLLFLNHPDAQKFKKMKFKFDFRASEITDEEWTQLSRLSNLKQLDLSGNEIGATGSLALVKALNHANFLEILNLGSNAIGNDTVILMSEHLKKLKALATLNLENNAIGPTGSNAVCKALSTSRSISQLNFAKNLIKVEGVEEIVHLLTHTQVTSIDLTGNQIENKGLKAIASKAAEMRALTSLNISQNRIDQDGAHSIAQLFEEAKHLTHLYAWGNPLGNEGAKIIADHFHFAKNLTALNLGYCGFTAPGIIHIAENLKNAESLTILDLWENELGNDGRKAIEEHRKDTGKLTQVTYHEDALFPVEPME